MELNRALHLLWLASSGEFDASQPDNQLQLEAAMELLMQSLRGLCEAQVFQQSRREDLSQDILLRLFERDEPLPQPVYEEPSVARGYLHRMVRNHSISTARREDRMILQDPQPEEQRPSIEGASGVVAQASPGPQGELELRREVRRCWGLFEALVEFSVEQRRGGAKTRHRENIEQMKALVLEEVDIPALMQGGSTEAALHQRHSRARRQLATDLEAFAQREQLPQADVEMLSRLILWLRRRQEGEA